MLKKVFSMMIALFLVLIIIGCVSMVIVPRLGYRLSIVGGGSMEPALDRGSLAVLRPADVQTIAVGDIIEYAPPSGSGISTIHRVIEVTDDGGALQFHTKGDANDSPDPYVVPAQNVRGRVWLAVPYLGYVLDYIGTPLGRSVILGVPALMLVAYELRNICVAIKARRSRRHRRRLVKATGTQMEKTNRVAARIQRG